MKITESQLRNIIKQELKKVLNENETPQRPATEALEKLKDISTKNRWIGKALLSTQEELSKQLEDVFGKGNYQLDMGHGRIDVTLYNYMNAYSETAPYEAFWSYKGWTEN